MKKKLLSIFITSLLLGSSVSNAKDQKIFVPMDEEKELGVELTPSEIKILNKKRNAILKYLLDKETLQTAKDEIIESERQTIFNKQLSNQFPVSPEDTLSIRKKAETHIKAENQPINEVHLDLSMIDLDINSSKPINIRVAKGYVSSLVFFDQLGNPWPVYGDVVGDKDAFKAEAVTEFKNVVTFEIAKKFKESNALLSLEGLSVPLVIRLIGDEKKVDSRVYTRVPRLSPKAKEENQKDSIYSQSESDKELPKEMLAFLNGDGDKVPGAVPYQLTGVDGEVYLYQGMLYIRSAALLLSPPSMGTATSPSGVNIFKINPVTNLFFSKKDGSTIDAVVEKQLNIKLNYKKTIF